MNWEQQVIKTFDLCISSLEGVRVVRTKKETGEVVFRGPPLAPLHHAVIASDVKINLSADGTFLGWEKIPDEDRLVVAPTSPGARSRTGDWETNPMPLVETFKAITAEPAEGVTRNNYVKLIDRWVNDESVQAAPMEAKEPLLALQKYLHSGSIAEDFSDEEKASLKAKKCRFTVSGCPHYQGMPELSKNTNLWHLWTQFMEREMEQLPKGLSYISGEVVPLLRWSNSPSGVFFGSKAKILCSNDGFGGTGYLTNRKNGFAGGAEACQIGEVEAQKITNMLRWILQSMSISPSGDSDVRMLAWAPQNPLLNLRSWYNGGESGELLIETIDGQIQPVTDSSAISNMLFNASQGSPIPAERAEALAGGGVSILTLKKTCDGRIAVMGYEDASPDGYFKRLQHWMDTTTYRGGDHKPRALTIKSILAAAYSRRERTKSESLPNYIVNDAVIVWNCINWGTKFPVKLADKAFARATAPVRYVADIGKSERDGYWPWFSAARRACAVIRKYQTDWGYDPEQDPNYERDVLYGRMLMWLERVEVISMLRRDIHSRNSNSWRLMDQYFRAPASTLARLLVKQQYYIKSPIISGMPSIQQAMGEIAKVQKRLQEIPGGMDNTRLGHNALLAYCEARDAISSDEEDYSDQDLPAEAE